MTSEESYELESHGAASSGGGTDADKEAARRELARRTSSSRWHVSKLLIRSFSTLLTCIAFVDIFASSISGSDDSSLLPSGLAIVGFPTALCCLLWDTSEYVTLSTRRGRGMAPKAHVGVELILFLMCLASCLVLGILIGPAMYSGQTGLNVAVIIFGVLTLTHFVLFVQACLTRNREMKTRMPRIMYVPETGQAVYVVAKLSTAPKRGARTPLPVRTSAGPYQRTLSSLGGGGRNDSPAAPPSVISLPATVATTVATTVVTTTMAPTERASSPAPTYHSRQVGSRAVDVPPSLLDEELLPLSPTIPPTIAATKNQQIRRKPLYPPPPEEDYVPDEAELERRRRGDAQPQLLSPNDIVYKFSGSVTGASPGDPRLAMDKFLLGSPLRKRESRASI